MAQQREITMQFHPRAFAAFGSDLVTNDAVAVTELVKNCYDAYAYNATVVFGSSNDNEAYIEIIDDGLGMTQKVVEESWAVIATPYKKKNPTVVRDRKVRRVSGNKGLGRFSAARLGRYLEIITKSDTDICFSARIDWDAFTNSRSITDCKIMLSALNSSCFKENTGTIIRITGLYEKWTEEKIDELQNSLSRLISPFESISDFDILLVTPKHDEPIKIQPQKFIKNPTYCIKGIVDNGGDIHWEYSYSPRGVLADERTDSIPWNEAQKGFDALHLIDESVSSLYHCGPFSFEIRAWDLDVDSIGDVSDTFDIGRREIRGNIAQYKGLSIYRDKVLVLPKSDASKDWLGIDLRRVSSIGKRISTSQIVGMVNITSENNPGIKDTTDREKLVDTVEYKQFAKVLETIVYTLENLRDVDRKEEKPKNRPTLSDLIAPLSAVSLESRVENMVRAGEPSEQILEAVRDYSADTEKNLHELHERLTYYAQTASLGSVAVVILHEILTGMTVIKRFLNRLIKQNTPMDEKTKEYFDDSENWHERLVQVANSFAPLYRKNLSAEKHITNIRTESLNSIRLILGKKEAKDINIHCEIDEKYYTSMHSGELQTVIVNLLDNACYWTQKSKDLKKITITAQMENPALLKIYVNDTGIGINNSDAKKIFQPGVTAKPYGIGMGLVIVTELLHNYNCKIATIVPGELGGATFCFEVPLVKESEVNR
ncbi:Adaptive-response sensory-kinase SasA [bioreactor metagenome]|uniref:Adaptive-response sensory-kinase SasA n=1 Tax=bioreactor metagenome TaxID=1076179 RepID=A0A644Z6M2_9ZZZZ